MRWYDRPIESGFVADSLSLRHVYLYLYVSREADRLFQSYRPKPQIGQLADSRGATDFYLAGCRVKPAGTPALHRSEAED